MENLCICQKRELILPGDFSLIALLLLPGSHKGWILLPFSARPFRLSFSVSANVRLHCRNTSSWCLKMRISDNWHSPTNSCGLTLPLRFYKVQKLRVGMIRKKQYDFFAITRWYLFCLCWLYWHILAPQIYHLVHCSVNWLTKYWTYYRLSLGKR